MTGSDPERLALAMLRSIEQKFEAGGDVTNDLADLLRTVRLVMESSLRDKEELRERCDRLLAHQTLLDERLLRVENNRLFRAWNAVSVKGVQLCRRAGQTLRKLRFGRFRSRPQTSEYLRWVNHQEAQLPSLVEHRRIAEHWLHRPLISIIMPVSQPDERWLAEAVGSVLARSYERWQLCLAADGAQPWPVPRLIEDSVSREPRIRFTSLPASEGIGASLNAASAMAEGEYLGFLNQDDVLSPLALHYIAECLQDAEPDLIYTDEDCLGPGNMRMQPTFKPDWSPGLLRSTIYPGRFLVVRREAFEGVQGVRAASHGEIPKDPPPIAGSVSQPDREGFHPRTGRGGSHTAEPPASDRAVARGRRRSREHHHLFQNRPPCRTLREVPTQSYSWAGL